MFERYFSDCLYKPLTLKGKINSSPDLIVTIPCYNEPEVMKTINSLAKSACPGINTLVIIHINCAAGELVQAKQNEITFKTINKWIPENTIPGFGVALILNNDLSVRHAGVGLARKIAMDEAAAIFYACKKPDNPIVCLDADCLVQDNYLEEIYNHFQKNPCIIGCNICFEHDLENGENKEAIINYELYLRYYTAGLRFSGFPYPYHTVGSSMAVRAGSYLKQGGMNKRQAGEDFYFLHKIFPLGNFSQLNSTCVFPSSRISSRVPFGTGATIMKLSSASGNNEYKVYNPKSFSSLKQLFDLVPSLYSSRTFHHFILPKSIHEFIADNKFELKLRELRKHTASPESFTKRFYTWFDGFKVLKYLHFAREHHYANLEVVEAIMQLPIGADLQQYSSSKEALLKEMRKLEKGI